MINDHLDNDQWIVKGQSQLMINDMGLDNLKYGLDQWSMDNG